MLETALLIIFGLVVSFYDKQRLFKKPYTGKKLFVILIFFAATFTTGIKGCYDDIQKTANTDTINVLNGRIIAMAGQISDLNQQAEDIYKSNLSEQIRHEQNIRDQDSVNTDKLLIKHIEGIKLGQANTNDILADARQNAIRLQAKLDSMETAMQPTLTLADENRPFKISQSNDTTYFYTPVRNSGQTAAINIHYKVYFLEVRGKELYEYLDNIGEVNNFTLDGKETFVFKGGPIFIPKYKFDESNDRQYVVVVGQYNSGDPRHPAPKKLELCYGWNTKDKSFITTGDQKIIIEAHNSGRVKYFGVFR